MKKRVRKKPNRPASLELVPRRKQRHVNFDFALRCLAEARHFNVSQKDEEGDATDKEKEAKPKRTSSKRKV